MLESWTKYIDREIISKYLSHTGSLACVCKASERECLAMSAGRLCCPTRQFYHPEDAKRVPWYRLDKMDAEEGLIEVVHRFSLNRKRGKDPDDPDEEKSTTDSCYKPYWRWSCCGENIFCTGCKAVCDADEGDDTDAAIQANMRAMQNDTVDENSSASSRVHWDASIYGDGSRWCNCEYKDGLSMNCFCPK